MKGKISILIAVIVIVLGYIIMKVLGSSKEENNKQRDYKSLKYVKVAAVEYTDIPTKIIAYGRLHALNQLDLISEVSGKILNSGKEFREGTYIEKGQFILKLDDKDARMNLYSLRSNFISSLVNLLPDMKSDYPEAFPKWKAYLDAFEIENTSPELPAVNSETVKYFLASRQIFAAYYSIKNAENQLAKYSFIAPFNGLISSTNTDPGSMVMPGQALGEFKGIDVHELQVAIDDQDAAYVAVNDKVDIVSEDMEGEWKGRVSRINATLDPSSQTIDVFITLQGKELSDGMYMKAIIHGEDMNNLFAVPREALLDQNHVYVLQDSSLTKKEVNVIRKDEERAYISGITINSLVVTEPLINVNPDLIVKAVEKKKIK